MKKRGLFLIFLSVSLTVYLFYQARPNPVVILLKPFLSAAQVSGLLGMVFFCYAFFLAGRFSFLEGIFGGLDKVYKLHQITGRLSFILLVTHFISLVFNYMPSTTMLSLLILPGKMLPYNLGIFGLWGMCVILGSMLYLRIDYQWFVRIQGFFIIPFTLGTFHMLLIPSDSSRFIPLTAFLLAHTVIAYISWFYRVLFYPLIGPRYEYKVESFASYPNDVVVVSLLPVDRKMSFLPGQFAYVKFDSIGVKKEFHPFSIASSPFEDRICLAIKASGDFTTQVKTIKVGEKAVLMGPYGKFSERFFNKKDSVCIAGGIGITPFLGMVNYFCGSKLAENKNLHLFYCVRNESDGVFESDLKRITFSKPNLSLKLVHTETDGRLSGEMIKNTIGELKNRLYFLCGPKIMMEDLTRQLKKLKIPAGNIIFEDFSYK